MNNQDESGKNWLEEWNEKRKAATWLPWRWQLDMKKLHGCWRVSAPFCTYGEMFISNNFLLSKVKIY
jgi:hypothetical protein